MKRFLSMLGLATLFVVALNVPAASAGGNWLEFRQMDRDAGRAPGPWDIFAVGETVVAKVDYLDGSLGSGDGPFHLWIERGVAVEAGRPIPSSAIRVATFEMASDGRSGRAVFELPSLPSGLRTLSICDDPCTERGFGFGEYVQGWLTVVQTPGEARLLARVYELRDISRANRRDARADLRIAELHEARLRSRLDTALGALEETRAEIDRMTRAAARTPERVLIDGAAGAWIAAGAVIIAAMVVRRSRRDHIVVPDTPAELTSDDRAPVGQRG